MLMFHVPARDALNEHAQSTLINGRGRYPGGPVVPLSVISVQRTKRYRFRLVNMACSAAFTFAIDKHTLTIIEADGEYTRPLTVDSLEIFAGQRYSVIFTADQAVGNYWLRANPDRGNPGYDGGRNQAILRYIGAPAADPTTVLNVKNPLKEQNLHALVDARPPGNPWVGGADVNINLVQSFNDTLFRFEMNGEVFEPPTVPVLLQILNGTHKPQELLPKGTVIPLPRNKVIEVSMPALPSTRSGPHPFHLHGHAFWVVRSGDNDTYNYVNPVRRDTVSTGLQTTAPNATIRFVTDNSGPWFLHCHIDWHLELGLAVVFAEDIPGIAQTKTTAQWKELCPLYEAWKSKEEGQ
ncbi:hypothetical protein DXG03_004881 [Asterophora parasitica]|uniref:laccase n=1 Tax=Asterophora parasitica TaxID=117018 RepID=A0A9P7GD22_9AGAR|nr:hypothetical protein DXG03_004881 [Asterophora parasitica]